MKQEQGNISKIESVTTVIVNIGTIISWLLTFFTAYVLTSQPQPVTLPGILELNATYKLIFLVSILLGYIQLLRRSWQSQKKSAKDVEETFGNYIYGSVIKLKRPLVLIGFMVILPIIFTVIFTEIIWLAGIIFLFGVVFLLIFFSVNGWVFVKREFDDDIRKRWLKRIKNQLFKNGYVHTTDFTNLPVELGEINWAIKLYFQIYEFQQDLTYRQKYIKHNFEKYKICEIRFNHVPSQLDE
jgi:hypothetical protein